MALKLITTPGSEPVSLDEAKLHLRIDADITDENALINAMIVAARQEAENQLGRALISQVWELALDAFPAEIRLPKPPAVSVTSVSYTDVNGTVQTLDSSAYQLDAHSEPARLVPAYGSSWPAARQQANAVLIRYAAGWADAAAVPQAIKNWMLIRIGTLYEHREEVVAGVSVAAVPFVDRLLDPYRIWTL